jgi:putative transposase
MARPLRIEYPGAFYHVTGTGSEGRRIFVSRADYEKFKEYLLEAGRKFNTLVHCYVLTGSQYQLIVESREANLSRFMHHLAGCYATYFNNRRKLSGHLFQGRYKAILIDEKRYLAELSRYLHLHPVKARLVRKPEEYQQSSYLAYILKDDQALVYTDLVLGMGSTDPRHARRKYREFVEEGMTEKLTSPVQKVYGQAIAGSPSFVKKVVTRFDKKQGLRSGTAKGRTIQRTSDMGRILAALSSYFEVPRTTFLAARGTYRNLAIYCAKKYTGLTNNEIGKRFGNITYSAVTRVAARVAERAQKDKDLLGQLHEIERKLAQVKA